MQEDRARSCVPHRLRPPGIHVRDSRSDPATPPCRERQESLRLEARIPYGPARPPLSDYLESRRSFAPARHPGRRLNAPTATRWSSSFLVLSFLGTPNQGAQNSQPTRPQAKSKPQAYPLGYVEDFDETRTKLGAVFSILLVLNGDGDDDPPHHIIQFEIAAWAVWVCVMTVDTRLRNGGIRIDGLERAVSSHLDESGKRLFRVFCNGLQPLSFEVCRRRVPDVNGPGTHQPVFEPGPFFADQAACFNQKLRRQRQNVLLLPILSGRHNAFGLEFIDHVGRIDGAIGLNDGVNLIGDFRRIQFCFGV